MVIKNTVKSRKSVSKITNKKTKKDVAMLTSVKEEALESNVLAETSETGDYSHLKVGQTVALSIHEIHQLSNVRYGWNTIKKIYDSKTKELVASMLASGYKKQHPIAVFFKDGKLIVEDGHRRLAAAEIASEEKALVEDMPRGYVWAIIIEAPSTEVSDGKTTYSLPSEVKLGINQVNSNKFLSRTAMDVSMIVQQVIDAEIVDTSTGKPAGKAAKYLILEKELGLSRNRVERYYFWAKYLTTSVKEWIQESEIAEDLLQVSISTATVSKILDFINENYDLGRSNDDIAEKAKLLNWGINTYKVKIGGKGLIEEADEKMFVHYGQNLVANYKYICQMISKQYPPTKKENAKELKETNKKEVEKSNNTELDNQNNSSEAASNGSIEQNNSGESSNISSGNSDNAAITKEHDDKEKSKKPEKDTFLKEADIRQQIINLVLSEHDSFILLLSDKLTCDNSKMPKAISEKLVRLLESYKEMQSAPF